MKKVMLFLSFFLLFTSHIQAKVNEALVYGECTGHSVNVREGKGFIFKPVDQLKKGEKVVILQISRNKSGFMGILKRKYRVMFKGRRVALERGKALTVLKKVGKFYKIAVSFKKIKKIFLIKKKHVLDILGFVKVKTPRGKVGWIVMKYIKMNKKDMKKVLHEIDVLEQE